MTKGTRCPNCGAVCDDVACQCPPTCFSANTVPDPERLMCQVTNSKSGYQHPVTESIFRADSPGRIGIEWLLKTNNTVTIDDGEYVVTYWMQGPDSD